MSTFDLHLFARPTAGPFTIQIIGDPVGGPAAPFALVQRYPEQREIAQRNTVDVGGRSVVIVADGSVNGNGEIFWNLADGSEGYLRSRGLDRDALVGIVASLTPRDPNAAIPGFDYAPDPAGPAALQLLVEHMNTGVQGRVTFFECQVASTTFIYRITAVVGDPVYEYAIVIDAPVPLEVGYRKGTLVVIRGITDRAAPTLDDVVNADPDVWGPLLIAPIV
jgi:hypothetical protein